MALSVAFRSYDLSTQPRYGYGTGTGTRKIMGEKTSAPTTARTHRTTWRQFSSYLYVMQAAIETFWLTCNKPDFRYFPSQKDASEQQYGRSALKPKPKTMKGSSFHQVDHPYSMSTIGRALLFATLEELNKTTQKIYDHFSRVIILMHVCSNNQKSETEAKYLPPSPSQAKSPPKKSLQTSI